MQRRDLLKWIGVAAVLPALPSWAGPAQKPQGTILGIFNPETPESVRDLGAMGVRVIVSNSHLQNGGSGIISANLANYKSMGNTVIATVPNWAGATKTPLPAPDSAEWKQRLDQFEAFLRVAGPSIDYCAIDNEPMFEIAPADFKPRGTGPAPVIEWYRALAQRGHAVIKSDAKLSHIRISSPAVNEVDQEAEGKNALTDLIKTLLDWESNDPNIDVLDIHLHVATVADIEAALTFMGERTKKPLIITEWSQAAAARDWLGKHLDPVFVKKWMADSRLTNSDFIKAAYDKPIEKREWDEFVATAPYDPAFMRNAFAAMVRHGVAVATYGADLQYGSEIFDSKQLLANMTVVPGPDGKPQENYQFANWYRDLAKAYASGTL